VTRRATPAVHEPAAQARRVGRAAAYLGVRASPPSPESPRESVIQPGVLPAATPQALRHVARPGAEVLQEILGLLANLARTGCTIQTYQQRAALRGGWNVSCQQRPALPHPGSPGAGGRLCPDLPSLTIMSPKIALRDKIATRHNSAIHVATKPYVDRRRRKSCVNKRIHQSRAAQLTEKATYVAKNEFSRQTRRGSALL
jgi:hypothetical protein